MSFKSIKDYEPGRRWMDRIKAKARGGREPSTLRIFPYYLFQFCKFAKMDPNQLITERLLDIKSDDLSTRRKHEELLTRWIGALQRDNIASNTIATACGAVRSFYASNYVPLVGVYVPSGVTSKVTMLPEPSQIALMVKNSDQRTRAWICCQKDSGISGEDLIALRLDAKSPVFGTIKNQLAQRGQHAIHVFLERGKGMSRGLGHYDTFFGEDAIVALRAYINRDAPSDARIFPFQKKTAELMVKSASVKVLGEPITPHALRKFFNTYMKLAKVNESVVEYWMGHSLGKVKSAYFLPPVQEQMKLYLEAYPHIAISKK